MHLLWTPTGTLDEDSFFEDVIHTILTSEADPLPPREQKISHVTVFWDGEPNSAFERSFLIQAIGGTHDDRLLARTIVANQLAAHGYREAAFSPDSFLKVADWGDVMSDAKMLVQSGGVRLLRNGYTNVVAQVQSQSHPGDTYDVEIFRQDPNSRAITGSDCTCSWGSFQNTPRTRQFKKFQNRPCLRGSTLIAMADGSYKPITDVQIGEKVWTHDGIGEVTEVMERQYQGKLISLASYGSGIPLVLTPEHEIWGFGTPQRLRKPWQEKPGQGFQFYDDLFLFDEEPEWIEPQDLKVHDWLTTPIPDQTFGGPLDLVSIIPEEWDYDEIDGRIYRYYTKTAQRKGQQPYRSRKKYQGSLPRYIYPSEALMVILGLFGAEGNIVMVGGHPGQIQWSFHLDEKATLAKALDDALRTLGIEGLSYHERPEVNALSCRLTHHPLALLLHTLAGRYAPQKQWHPWVMRLSPTDQEIIIQWHREGDGSESSSDSRWRIDTASSMLALQTRDLLLRCGKLPTWSVRRQQGGPTNRDKECTIYRVSWIDQSCRVNGTSGQRSDPHRSFVATKIRAIEQIDHDGPVYNLAIYPQQSYVADGRIVHNCKHIMSTFWVSQATPLDEDINPATQQGPSPAPQAPAGAPMMQSPAPMPGGLPEGSQGLVGLMPQGMPPEQPMGPSPADVPLGPSPRDVLPQFPMQGLQQGQINPASIPGLKGPSPTDPIQYPSGPGGTFSSVAEKDAGPNGPATFSSVHIADFQNGDIVQLRYDDDGVLVGRSEAHGAGQDTTVKAGQLGEVLGTHPASGLVNVLYMGGPYDKNKAMEPYGASAWHLPSYLIPRPDVKKPGPNVRRTR